MVYSLAGKSMFSICVCRRQSNVHGGSSHSCGQMPPNNVSELDGRIGCRS